MGCSCDWARTQFTFNEHNSRAVREWFFHLFKDGKIYRGKRLVNWDTFLQTAVSDDEVFHEATKGHFWHFKYPVIDPKPGEPTHVTIATTRPETMLGDTAVAVHPDPAAALDRAGAALREKLYSAPAKEKAEIESQIESLSRRRETTVPGLIQLRDMARRGAMLELPLTGRKIPLIADEWAKPELGSGAVKITPGHDANDYEVWQRHPEIGVIDLLNDDGTLNDAAPEKYRGLAVAKAREAVVADLEAAGLVAEIEDREIDLAHSDRSKKPIEPRRVDQWFMKMSDDLPLPPGEAWGEGALNALSRKPGLSQLAMDAVISGQVRMVPERYAKGYLDWLAEKRDWPIGRQLWWGHRIPVWRFGIRWGLYEKECSSIDDAMGKAQTEFNQSLKEFAQREGIGDAIAVNYPLADLAFVCARTVVAENKLKAFSERLRSSYHHGNAEPDDALPHGGIIPADRRLAAVITGIPINHDPQESDVLDTWFSSALWPISTMGWPDETPELKKFYPTSALITSRDIITLWVARMVIAGLYNVGEVPFHEVYITPKILDGYGETMSKSKGNGVDPLDVIEKFGADALRFGIAHLTTETQDVRMPVEFECPHCQAVFPQTKKNRQLPRIECEKCGKPFSTQWAEKPDDKALPRGAVVSERFELGRNFANKLWNAARFSLINLEGYSAPGSAGGFSDDALLLEDRWLLSRLATVTQQTTDALEHYRYADAARTLYDFAWNEFCSFYVEMTKARFGVPDQRETAQRVIAHALDVLMRLLHPMMPFLTEEVWQLLAQVAPNRSLPAAATIADSRDDSPSRDRKIAVKSTARAAPSICIAPWPTSDTSRQDPRIEQQFADFQAVLGAVREARQRQNIPFKEELAFTVRCNDATAKLLEPMQPYFAQMARAAATQWGPTAEPIGVPISITLAGQTGPIEVHVDVSRFIDVGAERKRLEKDRDNLTKQITSIEAKLANKGFADKAPAEVVQQQRNKLTELRGQLESATSALAKLPK